MIDWKVISQRTAWLLLALGCQYMARIDRPLDLAVWLTPVFLIRFFRDTGTFKAFLIAFGPLVAVNVLAGRGIIPLPSFSITLGLQIFLTLMALIPFLLDGLVHRILPSAGRVLLFPSLVVAIPFVRSVEGTYLHPGNALHDLILLQIAALAGVGGVTFVINLAATMLNEIWQQKESQKTMKLLAVTLLGGLLVVYGFGTLRLRSEIAPTRTLSAAAIVPDPSLREQLEASLVMFLSPDRQESEDAQALRQSRIGVFENLLARSVAIGQAGFDLAVWSEAAAIIFKEDEEALLQQASEAAAANQMHLAIAFALVETGIQPSESGPQPVFRNEMVLFSPTGEIEWRHRKSKLAPGMESAITIPGDGSLKASADGIGGAICYEMDFPEYIGQIGEIGASVLLAPSNDWVDIKNMHARSARLRAIENGIAVFRPTAGGLSIAVDQYGRTLARVDNSRSVEEPMTAILPVRRVATIYASLGNWLGWFCLSIVVLCAAVLVHRLLPSVFGRKTTQS
jgi:apolipoprotein N-acyltransferase